MNRTLVIVVVMLSASCEPKAPPSPRHWHRCASLTTEQWQAFHAFTARCFESAYLSHVCIDKAEHHFCECSWVEVLP